MVLEKSEGIEDGKKEDSLRIVELSKNELDDFRKDFEFFNSVDWEAEISALNNEYNGSKKPNTLIFKKLLQQKFNIDVDAGQEWSQADLNKILWLRKTVEKNNKTETFHTLSFDSFCFQNNTESSKEYLSYLETELTSALKISQFFGEHLQYKPDRMNRQWNNVPREVVKKTESDGTETWIVSQSELDNWRNPLELINSIEGGFINGDCEDFGFLAQYFLSKINPAIKSQVVQVGGHATCVWVEKNKQGRFNARTLGGYGYDLNSYVRKPLPFGENTSYGNTEVFDKTGYETIGEALNSVLIKYKKSYGEVVVANDNNPIVTIMETKKMPNGTVRQVYRRGDLSHEFLN